MKKTYIAPLCATFNLQTEGVIASSVLGNGNNTINPGNKESNDAFRSKKDIWGSSNMWGE